MSPDAVVTRREFRTWKREVLVGLAILFLGMAYVGYDNSSTAHTACERSNQVSAVVSAGFVQQKILSQAKYEQGKTEKADWEQQQAALNKAIAGLATQKC